jgi:hypothetical protein
MLPGSGCFGIGAMTTGVLMPVRSQLRQVYLNRAFCRNVAFTSMPAMACGRVSCPPAFRSPAIPCPVERRHHRGLRCLRPPQGQPARPPQGPHQPSAPSQPDQIVAYRCQSARAIQCHVSTVSVVDTESLTAPSVNRCGEFHAYVSMLVDDWIVRDDDLAGPVRGDDRLGIHGLDCRPQGIAVIGFIGEQYPSGGDRR